MHRGGMLAFAKTKLRKGQPVSFDVLVQMNPVDSIDIKGDTSFAMMLEAQRRGHRISSYKAGDLLLRDGKLWTHATSLQLRDEVGNHFTAEAPVTREVADADVVLMRQDPPFNMNYITATYLLESVVSDVLVVNEPAAVRNAPEKLLVGQFPDFIPPTLVSANAEDIRNFHDAYKDIIIKPLYGNGGEGVFRIGEDGINLNVLLDTFARQYGALPLVVQKFLPQVFDGDKRIILLDGKAVGAIDRFPSSGEVRANMHVGGKAAATELSDRDALICDAVGIELCKRGLLFAGIDVIGGYLIEINVTSPTGIREIANFGGEDIAALFWDCIEARVG